MFQIYYWPLSPPPLPHPSLFFTGNKLLKNSPYVLTCLIAPFFNIPFTSVSISFCCSRFFPTGKKSLIEKVSFEKVLHNHLLNPGYSDPWLVFFQVFEKCFSLPAVGTFGTLFEENNLFISGWTFSNSQFKLISGTEFMLKKVSHEECIFTVSLLTCFCL